ncbi:hypothetical protein RHMOL_Rhmol08G0244200 [Rhododendron molle]|uniref:Uncharacterized protein n=1 Tax=Rhododendron molle TaxID=49168 RepID=A0ACC0MT74_RHOML|nr:hypothetical protein RHMOL_Rhmol08G0244200 [Rhododendron molle]
MDPGNIFLNTPVKVNFKPYGIDFPGGPTGGFTNGYTIADFWYKWSNKSLEPILLPYLHPLCKLKSNTKGFNYASETVGILRDTSRSIGENLPLGQQVKLFKETAEQYLPSLRAYNNKTKLSNALSKSIFVVRMGCNDYMNYLQPRSNTSKLYNAEQFGEFLVNELGNHLQGLAMEGSHVVLRESMGVEIANQELCLAKVGNHMYFGIECIQQRQYTSTLQVNVSMEKAFALP